MFVFVCERKNKRTSDWPWERGKGKGERGKGKKEKERKKRKERKGKKGKKEKKERNKRKERAVTMPGSDFLLDNLSLEKLTGSFIQWAPKLGDSLCT